MRASYREKQQRASYWKIDSCLLIQSSEEEWGKGIKKKDKGGLEWEKGISEEMWTADGTI